MFETTLRLLGVPIRLKARALAREFLDQTARADVAQRDRLLQLVARHADSAFGRDHHFHEIRSPADFRKRVPIRGYEGHEPYIDRVRNGEVSALFGPGTEVLMFALTSGTTARPKTIPVTRETVRDYREGWMIWGIQMFDAFPETYLRGQLPILQVAGDWRESTTPAGIPCGAITGLTARMQNPLVRTTYTMHPAASRIKDVAAKYYVALRLSVYREVGTIIAANPSTVLGIARLGDREQETLIRDLADGTLDPRWPIPQDIRKAMAFRIRRKRRATSRRLEAIVERTGRLLPRDYWPGLKVLANWTGGTMGAYLRHYPEFFGNTPVRDPGLIASEGRMTIPVENNTPAGILDVRHHYFEFTPEDQIDRDEPETVEAADLVEGERYFILPTTSGGLYRYQIHDLVRCVGFHGKAPVIEFLNKGAHISSLTGEKLSEFQVVAAVAEAQRALGLTLKAFLALPTWDDPPYYSLLVERDDLGGVAAGERLAAEVDARLRRLNVEYESKRATLRLGPVRTRGLPPGSWEDFRRRRLAKSGGTVEQYKQPCLMADLSAIDSFPIDRAAASRPA
ncbi:MAG TPA: GH3 auxin-responsive promoter family protein [Isosphaeraceae bacterium]|jgi:hypothetical protein|nr:GH3 auxin-responsive promoter family protein [Isosphaeraceae bacterium]